MVINHSYGKGWSITSPSLTSPFNRLKISTSPCNISFLRGAKSVLSLKVYPFLKSIHPPPSHRQDLRLPRRKQNAPLSSGMGVRNDRLGLMKWWRRWRVYFRVRQRKIEGDDDEETWFEKFRSILWLWWWIRSVHSLLFSLSPTDSCNSSSSDASSDTTEEARHPLLSPSSW